MLLVGDRLMCLAMHIGLALDAAWPVDCDAAYCRPYYRVGVFFVFGMAYFLPIGRLGGLDWAGLA